MLLAFIILNLLLPVDNNEYCLEGETPLQQMCLNRIKLGYPRPRFPGDSYPYCVDVVGVHPPPLSLLKPDSEGKLTFKVQFSRPVVYAPDTQYYENNEFKPTVTKDAYLTPSLSKMQKVGGPISVSYTGDSYLWRKYVFQLAQDEIKMLSKLYLVIDGEQLYVESYLLRGVMTTFVPLSIFGEYYIDPALAAGKTPRQVQQTPHCYERYRRPLPDPYYEDHVHSQISISVASDPQAHSLSNNDQLQLTLKAFGAGDMSIQLPERIKGVYNGINVSIGIPAGQVIRINRNDGYHRIPTKTKIIHEVYERVYHTRAVLPVQRRGFTSHLPEPNYQDLLNLDIQNGIYTLRAAQTSFLLFIAVPFSGNNYAFYSREGGIWRLKSDPYGPNANFRFFERNYNVPAFYSRECDADSIRTRPTMKRGLTVHTYELGTHYRLIEPDIDAPERWYTYRKTKIYLQSKDITALASFGVGSGFNVKLIPKFLYDALSKYVVLLRPFSQQNWMVLALDEGIFVPRSQLHKNCGGILMFENENYREGNDFCEKKMGSCTGLPWTSTERFPVIPPFGVPEFAGWTYDRSKMESTSYLGYVIHPLNYHFEDWLQSVPKAIYHYRNRRGYIIITGQDASTDYITVPVSGVRLLSPNLDFSSCNKVWSINNVLQRETTLTIYLNNNGLGGADVTVKVLCTRGLIVIPSNGVKTQWVEAKTNVRVTFKLDATLVATKEKETHYCHLNISVHSTQSPPRSLECPKVAIKSYAGLFTDPCKLKKTPLPGTSLKFFVLPRSQLNESSGVTISTLLTTGPQVLVFMRAISVILTVSREEYLSNLLKVVVHCENPNMLVIEEEEAGHEALLLLLKRIEVASFWNKKPINFYSSFLKRRRFYFFAVRKWLLETNGTVRAPSGCSIKVAANRPHRLCNKPETVDEVYVPLIHEDIGYITNIRRSEFWYLEPIYGKQSKGVIITLFLCIGLLVLFSLLTGSGHAILLIFRKQLPSLRKKSKLRRKIDQLKAIDKKSWEMPQMYLQKGKYGPHYILYNFKCTESLSTCDLKSLKVAGQLKYEEKELQVLFGHVKNIYKKELDHSGDIWLQASSGWYLLQAGNVSPEYVDHLNDYYKDCGIKVEVMKRE